ncbi:MAG: hypothetical protein PHC70_01630 [Patescibacteria group bacterium]|nr:hypothetical protein [Patescibacteria group bacterium]
MKLRSLAFLLVFVGLTGCGGNSEITAAPPETEAGVDAKSDAADAGKDAETGTDAQLEAQPDVSADTQTETGIETGTDAPPDITIDGAVQLAAGDLIKGSQPAVYYYGPDQSRHTFPNENTFNAWFTPEDLNLVKTIPDEQLSIIPMGKNVTIRPGTYLVKITTDPKVYAVTNCAQLHWIESESIIAALYGANWASRIIDVPDTVWPDYTQGASITTSIHPDGTLISYSGDLNRYVVTSGLKRKIASDAAFTANHFQAQFIVQTTIPYADGADVTSSEPQNFWQIVCQ